MPKADVVNDTDHTVLLLVRKLANREAVLVSEGADQPNKPVTSAAEDTDALDMYMELEEVRVRLAFLRKYVNEM